MPKQFTCDEGWWDKDNTKLAYCKCGKVMVIVEEPCIS